MNYRLVLIAALALVIIQISNAPLSAQTLSLNQAVRIAVQVRDPSVARFDEKAGSL